MKTTHSASQIDYSRKWLVMAVLGMGIFLATIDGSIVNIALPTLVKAFNARFETVQWVVLSYLLTLGTMMLGIGRLADMVGKKPIYLIGMVLFTLGSLLCGISPTVYWLIGSRIFQGIGASMMMALGIGILTESFPPQERGKAMGTSGAIVSVGIILGPTLGGFLIHLISWHWIFFVNLPIGIIGSVMVARILPDIKGAQGQKFDFLGAGAMFISLLSFLLALTVGQKIGFTHPAILSMLAGWFIFFILFLKQETRSAHPMVDLRLFRNQLFSLSLFTGFSTFICTAGIVLLMPFYLENVLAFNPQQTGMMLAIVPVSAGIISPLSGSLSDRFGTRPVTVIGLVFMLIGYASLLNLNESTTVLGYLIRFFPVGFGIGIFQSPNNSAIMGASPKDKLGIVSSLLSLTRVLGQTSGIAALGAFWASRVSAHAGGLNAAQTDPLAQVAGLFDTFIIVVAIITMALVMSIISFAREWRMRRSS